MYNANWLIKVKFNKRWEQDMNNTYLKTFEEYCEENIFEFPIIVKSEFKEMKRIHPQKQYQISQIYNEFKDYSLIQKIIIFGSTISMKCNIYSDLDLAIKLTQNTSSAKNIVSEKIGLITDWNYDIIWLDDTDLSEPIVEKIENGVIIFE